MSEDFGCDECKQMAQRIAELEAELAEVRNLARAVADAKRLALRLKQPSGYVHSKPVFDAIGALAAVLPDETPNFLRKLPELTKIYNEKENTDDPTTIP